jgi:hypothetical protein
MMPDRCPGPDFYLLLHLKIGHSKYRTGQSELGKRVDPKPVIHLKGSTDSRLDVGDTQPGNMNLKDVTYSGTPVCHYSDLFPECRL